MRRALPVLLAALALAPVAASQSLSQTGITGGAICFHDTDDDGSGQFNPGAIAYVKVTGGTSVHAGDVRLSNATGLAAGIVKAGDTDLGKAVEVIPDHGAIPGDWKYYDASGSGSFDDGDVL